MNGHHNPKGWAYRVAAIVLREPNLGRGAIIERLKAEQETAGLTFNATDTTVYRYIERAIEAGLISCRGATSGATYLATPDMRKVWLREQVNRELGKRPRVGYDERFLDSYVPNKTFYLSTEQRSALAARCPVGSAPLKRLGSRMLTQFLTDIAFSSSKLEGNRYDYASTVALINDRVEMAGATPQERIMLENHYEATRHLINNQPPPGATPNGLNQYVGLDPRTIFELHSLLAGGLIRNPLSVGALRREDVVLMKSAYCPPSHPRLPPLFTKLLKKASRIRDPWEAAVFLKAHLSILQPFADANKRLGRVACNIPLIAAAVTPMSWHEVDHSAYIDAMLAVYEHRDPLLLAEVFTDGYLRSSERFDLLYRPAEPSEVIAVLRKEVKEAVRAAILQGEILVPTGVPADMEQRFLDHVAVEVQTLLVNPVGAVRFGLLEREIEAHRLRQQEAANETSDGDETPRERMRA